MTVLTDRYTRAVDYAREAHATQTRKGTQIPYLYHLLAVSSLVLEFGGNEDQAIAALLHDVIEDCGATHAAAIRSAFGDAVAAIVVACTDGSAEARAEHATPEARSADWTARKQRYLAHLAEASDEVLLVSCCDKLHNARSIVQDLESPAVGVSVFQRFTGGKSGTLWYYDALSRIFSSRGSPPAACFERVVARLHDAATH